MGNAEQQKRGRVRFQEAQALARTVNCYISLQYEKDLACSLSSDNFHNVSIMSHTMTELFFVFKRNNSPLFLSDLS